MVKKPFQFFIWTNSKNYSYFVDEGEMEFFASRFEAFIIGFDCEECVDGFGAKGEDCIRSKEIPKHKNKQMLQASYFTKDICQIIGGYAFKSKDFKIQQLP